MNGAKIAGNVISGIGVILLFISAVFNYWYTPTGTTFVIIGTMVMFIGMCIMLSAKKEEK